MRMHNSMRIRTFFWRKCPACDCAFPPKDSSIIGFALTTLIPSSKTAWYRWVGYHPSCPPDCTVLLGCMSTLDPKPAVVGFDSTTPSHQSWDYEEAWIKNDVLKSTSQELSGWSQCVSQICFGRFWFFFKFVCQNRLHLPRTYYSCEEWSNFHFPGWELVGL